MGLQHGLLEVQLQHCGHQRWTIKTDDCGVAALLCLISFVCFDLRFKKAISENFDPETDLTSIGLANQTTMLRNETMEIGKLLERTMMEKYGPANLKNHYMVMDTICDATQVPATVPDPGQHQFSVADHARIEMA